MQHLLTGGTEAPPKKRLTGPPPPKRKRDYKPTKEDDRKAAFWSMQVAPAHQEETIFRHSAWRQKRQLVRTALAEVNTNANALERFDQCGSECVVEICPDDQTLRVRANYCRNRHCQPCNQAKANRLAANLRNRLQSQPHGRYRFITLTLRHTDTPLAHQIKRLYTSFAKLRKEKIWKRTQRGGAAILEVKWQPDTRKWHPHLHVIAEGDFVRQADLSNAWLTITGDSHVVDIRALKESKDAAFYIAKYVSKGTNDAVWIDPDARQEWIVATKSVRSAATFGTWRGFKLLAVNADTKEWKPLGTLYRIVQDAREGKKWAQAILARLNEEVKFNPNRPRKKEPCPAPSSSQP